MIKPENYTPFVLTLVVDTISSQKVLSKFQIISVYVRIQSIATIRIECVTDTEELLAIRIYVI